MRGSGDRPAVAVEEGPELFESLGMDPLALSLLDTGDDFHLDPGGLGEAIRTPPRFLEKRVEILCEVHGLHSRQT